MTGSKLKFGVGGGLIFLGLMLLAVWSARSPGSFAFYITPTELVRSEAELQGKDVRVAAAIEPGSVERSGRAMTFVVTDGRSRVAVSYVGAVPYTFRQAWETKGWEVVVEGRLVGRSRLRAKQVFVRHPPEMIARK